MAAIEKKAEIAAHEDREHAKDFAVLAAEEVHYGQAGVKAFLSSPYVFGAALLASMGGFSYGYDQGVISLILVMPQFRTQYPQVDAAARHYGFNTGFMTGMLLLGGFLGCLCYPYVADKLSRKWALSIAVAFFDVGAIIQTAAPDYGTLVAGRAIGGIGVGTLAMGAPLYISEISPPEMRGSLLVLEELTIVIGAIISYWVTYGTKDLAGAAAFRVPFGLQMVPATILGICIHFFPYSPRWLVMADRADDSLQALSRLRRLPADDHRVQAEWRSIIGEVAFQDELAKKHHPGAGGLKLEILRWNDLFKRDTLKRTTVACGICFFTQFSGINAFVYYAPTLFTSLGQSSSMSIILAGMINIGQFVGVAPAMVFMDNIGRRNMAIWGALGMGIAHTIMAGVYGAFGDSWPQHQAGGWACVAFVYAYVVIFGLSYGPLIWTLPSEV
jgi:sugar porter (SP) family MFS transporter